MLIHVGLPRTGSTTLQDDVFNRASHVYYLGRIRGSKQLEPTCRSADAIDAILRSSDADFETVLPGLQSRLEQHLESARRSGTTPVISHEGLAWNYDRPPRLLAQRCRRVFGPGKVLIIAREQRRWLVSCYLKYVKANLMKGRLEEAVNLTFEEYVSRARKGEVWGTAAFHLGDIVDAYSESFGAENTFVMPNEWLRKDRSAFLETLGHLTGSDPNELGGLLTRASNISLNVGEIRYLRTCRLLRMAPRTNGMTYRVFKRLWNGAGAAAVSISPRIERWIADSVAEQNHRISVEKRLNLRELGYLLERTDNRSS